MEMADIGMPPCFSDRDDWNEYVQLHIRTRGGKVIYCTDCTPEYRDRMIEQKRCSYPETVFVLDDDGELLGINAIRWYGWVNALTGKRGKLVSSCDPKVRDALIIERYKTDNKRRTGVVEQPDTENA